MSVVALLRFGVISITAAVFAGCATAPTTSGPVSSQPSSGPFARLLHLCNGNHIDNAPPTDSKKHVIGYRPVANISGVYIARAPVRKACLSSGFGYRHDRAGRHNGIDLSTGHSHNVYAGGDGVVEEMRNAGGYGKMILIRHNGGIKTRYGHLSSYASNLHVGHEVRSGDVIGRTGSTGNAEAVILHYEIIVNGSPRDPLSVGR